MAHEVVAEIRELRVKGWTLSALADQMGVHRDTLTYWLSGKRTPAHPAAVLRALKELEQWTRIPKRKRYGAGLYRQHRSGVTGTMVSIYDARQSKNAFDPSGGRWVTVCEDHGTTCNHQTLRLARHHAPLVGWCKECQRKPESTEGRPWGQPLKKPAGAPLNLG